MCFVYISDVDMVAGITGGVAGSCIVIFIAVFLLWRKKKLSSPFQRHPFGECYYLHFSYNSYPANLFSQGSIYHAWVLPLK